MKVARVPVVIAVFLVLLLLAFSSCSLFEPEPVSARFKAMGTEASVTLAGPDRARLAAAEAQTRGVMARLDEELSVYRADSAISRLNQQAGITSVELPADSLRLLALSREYGDLSAGAFDVTVGPIVQLWRDGGNRPVALPSEEALRERLGLVGYRRVSLEGRRAFLPIKGMQVDLGGIAKGYAVDAAWESCRRQGLANFMIDLGGNLRVSGRPGRSSVWHVGVRNPFDRSVSAARLEIPEGWAVATSGQYERFVEIEGRRYGHIIDPRTGYPASGLAGVTVLASDATAADALSTSVFVLGPKASVPVLKKTKAEAVLIPDKEPLELWITPGMEKRLIDVGPATIRRLPGF